MHPAAARRRKHEAHELSGEPLKVHRNGAVIGTVERVGGLGSYYKATTADGRVLAGPWRKILDAELVIVNDAKNREAI